MGDLGDFSGSPFADLRPVLIYDGDCRLCVSSKRWIERWDRRRRIRTIPFQSPEARGRLPELDAMTCMDAMRFIDAEGKVFSGVDAFRAMLPFLPFGFLLSSLLSLPGVHRIVQRLYRHVAENRYRWFGHASEEK
jgi:predicted DCC family thiol-disulfide oxidoreductase YuxK